jgi:hypothetical protein
MGNMGFKSDDFVSKWGAERLGSDWVDSV